MGCSGRCKYHPGPSIIRTSVDHGTAFDQAGTGKASDISLLNAIEYAVMFAENKK